MPSKPAKKTREEARESLPTSLRSEFDRLVKDVSDWSVYFYGSKFISYAILAELIRDGWSKRN